MNQKTLIESLNGLRGIAVLAVIFSHTGSAKLLLLPHLNLSGIGQYGVILFFFLSSFLLSRPFFQNPESIYDYKKWIYYAFRRILRVLPMYYLVVLLDYFVINTNLSGNNTNSLINHLLFIKGTSIYWSVPVEMQFYLLLPFFIVAFILCSRNKIAFTSLLTLIAGYFVMNGVYSYTNSFWETLFIHRYVPCFIAGIATSYFFVKSENIGPSLKKTRMEALAIFCILLMITQIPSVWYYLNGLTFDIKVTTEWEQFYKYRHLLATFLFSIIVYCFLRSKGFINRILTNKLLMSVGKVSFSMYLLHLITIDVVIHHFHVSTYIQAVSVFVFTFLISLVSYYIIEKPFMDLSKYKPLTSLIRKKQLGVKA